VYSTASSYSDPASSINCCWPTVVENIASHHSAHNFLYHQGNNFSARYFLMNNTVGHCQAGIGHLRKFLNCPAVPVSELYISLSLSVVRPLIFFQSDFKEANVGFTYRDRSLPVVVNLKPQILHGTFSSSTWNARINIDCLVSAVKLELTSPTGGGRSVGIVRSRTKAMEFSLV
jgi:hypothetical protein